MSDGDCAWMMAWDQHFTLDLIRTHLWHPWVSPNRGCVLGFLIAGLFHLLPSSIQLHWGSEPVVSAGHLLAGLQTPHAIPGWSRPRMAVSAHPRLMVALCVPVWLHPWPHESWTVVLACSCVECFFCVHGDCICGHGQLGMAVWGFGGCVSRHHW